MSKMQDPSRQLGNQLCFAVYSTAHAINRFYKTLLEPLGLTYPQYLVMLVLWDQGDVSVKQLGASLQLDSGTLTPLLKRLEQNGVIRRRRSAEDERRVIVALTEAGRALNQKAAGIPHQLLCASALNPDQLMALRADITQLRDRMLEQAETVHTNP